MQTPTLHWETLPLATQLGVNAIASGVLEYFLPSIPFFLILFSADNFGYPSADFYLFGVGETPDFVLLVDKMLFTGADS